MNWIVEALKNGHDEEKKYRAAELTRLQKRFDHIQIRLDAAYVDKLDGTIDDCYWNGVSSRWRSEQDQLLAQIEKLKGSNREYVDEGVRILELAQQAHSLYVSQTPQEKNKLLRCVLSNSVFDGVNLSPTYEKPFDLIIEGIEKQIKLPRLDLNQRPAD